MIFYTVGTQLPFDRLTKFVDDFALKTEIPIYGQIGSGNYKPSNFDYCEQLEVSEFESKFNASDIIISHAGMGTILQSLVAGKIICICARQAEFNEHRNNHQLATVERFRAWNNVIEICSAEDLNSSILALDSKSDGNLSEWASKEMIEKLNSLIVSK
jgi:UDP-N-acetylglucosamine transferase subunit ALG13